MGFETKDDAGVFALPDGSALVQTMDFFTPIVDDPYAYGQIAAANALSDVYAMGGKPLTAMNIACFDPDMAPADVWAYILRGMYDKTLEAGAVVVGGHSVVDREPKFGLSVTGLIDSSQVISNDRARVGDEIYLSKSLGTGIVTTAAKHDACPPECLQAAIDSMIMLNGQAAQAAKEAGAVCATDITGFGLAGHLLNIALASRVAIEIESNNLPLLPGVRQMVEAGMTTGGADKNRAYLGERLLFREEVSSVLQAIVLDPQTSGGLAVLSAKPVVGSVLIGRVIEGRPQIIVR